MRHGNCRIGNVDSILRNPEITTLSYQSGNSCKLFVKFSSSTSASSDALRSHYVPITFYRTAFMAYGATSSEIEIIKLTSTTLSSSFQHHRCLNGKRNLRKLMPRSLQEEVRLDSAKRSRRKRRVKVQLPGCFLYEQVLLRLSTQHNESRPLDPTYS